MNILQILFFLIIVRPIISLILGLHIEGEDRLPAKGPAIIAANHNSHLDAVTLVSLWPLTKIHQVRSVAAADYFLANRFMAWFSQTIIGIIPIDRKRKDKDSDPLAPLSEALSRDEILIIFPEGSRGAPEELSQFKSGISRLAERHPNVPIIPVFMYGLGKSLPRGTFMLVPFFVDVAIGEPIYWQESVDATMDAYRTTMTTLAEQIKVPDWT